MKKGGWIFLALLAMAAAVIFWVLPAMRRNAYMSGYNNAKDKSARERTQVVVPVFFSSHYLRGHHHACTNCPPTPQPSDPPPTT